MHTRAHSTSGALVLTPLKVREKTWDPLLKRRSYSGVQGCHQRHAHRRTIRLVEAFMTRSDHSATPAPVGRTDSTRPRRTGRDEDRRPYPSAPARTATSRRGTCRAGTPTRSQTAFTAPTPATVWACGPTPIDPDTPWPTALLTKIVTSFSEPGDRVVVLTRPTAAPTPPHRPGRSDALTDHATTAHPA